MARTATGGVRKSFAETRCYRVAVPSFFGGDMIFVLAGQQTMALEAAPEDLEHRFAEAGIATRYYAPAIHSAAFALPPYVAELITG